MSAGGPTRGSWRRGSDRRALGGIGARSGHALLTLGGPRPRSMPSEACACCPRLKLATRHPDHPPHLAGQAMESVGESGAQPGDLAAARTYKGCTTSSAFTPIQGLGGARNRADRESLTIGDAAARNVEAAVWWAVQAGLPLNRFWSIHWQLAGVGDPLKATGRFLKLYGDYLRRNGVEPAYVWVREGGAAKGEHVHILAHAPPVMHVARRQRGWLAQCGAAWRLGVLNSRPVGRTYAYAWQAPDAYEANLAMALRYVLKGGDSQTCGRLGMDHAPQGRLIGKRCGVSQNLGPAARSKAACHDMLG